MEGEEESVGMGRGKWEEEEEEEALMRLGQNGYQIHKYKCYNFSKSFQIEKKK